MVLARILICAPLIKKSTSAESVFLLSIRGERYRFPSGFRVPVFNGLPLLTGGICRR